jgi:hypothetical protein
MRQRGRQQMNGCPNALTGDPHERFSNTDLFSIRFPIFDEGVGNYRWQLRLGAALASGRERIREKKDGRVRASEPAVVFLQRMRLFNLQIAKITSARILIT